MVFKVAGVVAIEAKIGVKVEWIDKTLSKIATKGDHFALLQEARILRKEIEELEREKEIAERCLVKIDTEIVYKDYGNHTITNYRICVVKGLE